MPGRLDGVFKWRAVHLCQHERKEAMKVSNSNYEIIMFPNVRDHKKSSGLKGKCLYSSCVRRGGGRFVLKS